MDLISMNTDFNINMVMKQGKIQNELDFERALIADRKLRILIKEHPENIPIRRKIRNLIEAWENKHWSANAPISDEKIHENDWAASTAEQERLFVEKRRILIKAKL
jgi:hypothetical protein